ncbi:MAG: hypothetical protein V4702_04230 [Patescibacteria group bacterium]
MTKIVSAFPGCGKSFLTENYDSTSPVLDSDSSGYSWLHQDDGTKVRNPDFPRNYLDHIQSNIGEAAIILVSSHAEVREALAEEGIDYTLVYPETELKQDYLERFQRRGSPAAFVDLLDRKWDEFIGDLECDATPRKVVLGQGQYLSDVVDEL